MFAAPNEPADVLDHVGSGTQIIVPLANGEPTAIIDAIEDAARANAPQIDEVCIHQMHALHDRSYLRGEFGNGLKHISYFLSHITRPCFANGTIGLVPAHFSEVYAMMRTRAQDPLVVAAASPPDQHGYFSLGVTADYIASFIGRGRFFLEVTDAMPRTFGRNQIHITQVEGWCRSDRPLIEVQPAQPAEADLTIAQHVAERIPNGATIQTGIGAIPNAIMASLTDHRDLGVHTELLSDPIIDLVEAGAVTGVNKRGYRGRMVTTFALGSRRLYDFCHGNDAVVFLAVDEVNDPRNVGREPNLRSINATLEVDLFGQCASETLGSTYWSGSGGQADFARGAQYSPGGDGFVVLRSTTGGGRISRIVPTLQNGAVVTTQKNTVDNVVTEYGVAELRGQTLAERAEALIDVADPAHRDWLEREARSMNLLARR